MARDSLAAAHAELFAQLHAGNQMSVIDGVTVIYPHHVGRGLMLKPVTVTVTPAGRTPDDWVCAIRVYTWIGDDDVDLVAANSDLHLAVVEGIEDAVDGHWGPTNWTIGPHPDQEDTLFAEWLVTCGREDF